MGAIRSSSPWSSSSADPTRWQDTSVHDVLYTLPGTGEENPYKLARTGPGRFIHKGWVGWLLQVPLHLQQH